MTAVEFVVALVVVCSVVVTVGFAVVVVAAVVLDVRAARRRRTLEQALSVARARVDELAGPRVASMDFAGATVGGPELCDGLGGPGYPSPACPGRVVVRGGRLLPLRPPVHLEQQPWTWGP